MKTSEQLIPNNNEIVKTISLEEFKAAIALEEWNRVFKESESFDYIDVELLGGGVRCKQYGEVTKQSSRDGMVITFSAQYTFFVDDQDSIEFTWGGGFEEPVWRVEGVLVIDEDGEEVDINDLVDCLFDTDFQAFENEFEFDGV